MTLLTATNYDCNLIILQSVQSDETDPGKQSKRATNYIQIFLQTFDFDILTKFALKASGILFSDCKGFLKCNGCLKRTLQRFKIKVKPLECFRHPVNGAEGRRLSTWNEG